jgi:hypothetical protein
MMFQRLTAEHLISTIGWRVKLGDRMVDPLAPTSWLPTCALLDIIASLQGQ